jgi:very-short-patch-repair endonuclease
VSVASARRLRRAMTDAETVLWRRLRDGQLDGIKFRRQVPLGGYVLDFYCEAEKLVVEVDGGQHADNPGPDAVRTAWLESCDCRVIRFWNHDVLQNVDGVLETILMTLGRKLS